MNLGGARDSALAASTSPRATRTTAARTFAARFETEVACEEHVPDGADGSLVVALHGMGQSAAEFAPEALACAPPRAAVLVPQGPYPFEKRRRGGPPERGNAWYVWTGDSEEFVRSLEQVERWLLGLVPRRYDRVALLGFSQGGYLAGFAGLRNPDRFRAVVVAGGRLKDEVLADAAPRAAAAGLRVLDVHGAEDAHVKPETCRASAERLTAAGVAVDFRTYPCDHAVLRDARCRDDVRAFLADALGGAGR